MSKIKIIIPVSAVLLLIVIGIAVIDFAKKSSQDIPVLYDLPGFEFTDQDSIAFTRDSLKNRITVVDFIFTNCPGPCPLMSAEIAKLYDFYSGFPQVNFLSISVDPMRDDLSALKEYADKFGVNDRRWRFVRDEMEATMDLYEFGFKLGGMLPAGHSTKFVLVDQNAQIRGYYSSDDPISLSILKDHINILIKN